MKIEIEIKRTGDKPPTYTGTITAGKIKETSAWSADADALRGVKKRGMNLDYLAYYNLGRQLLTDLFRTRFYPPGDPMKSPAQRKAKLDEDAKVLKEKADADKKLKEAK